jgi:glycosyltransferase involved in cell wall biosynthesis
MTPGIHQVLGGAGKWDAITNHALAAQEVIRDMGFRSEVFADARHLSGAVQGRVLPHHQWNAVTHAGDAAILHYSIESPAFDVALSSGGTVALHYHNVTPPELLWRDAPGVALQCKAGLAGLRELAPRVSHPAAVSAFNAAEMRRAGFDDPSVIGILRQGLPRAGRRRHDDGRLRLLFVGRGIPNKRQDALVMTLAGLRECGVDAEVRLVGGWGACRPYRERCERLAAELDVSEHTTFLGAIGDEELAQEYADADVFVCVSEHEGYCVPIVEAMAHDLPIVALRAGAVPETLGRAGLLVDELRPSLLAEAIMIAGEPGTRNQFAPARERQLALHSPLEVPARLQGFVREIAASC